MEEEYAVLGSLRVLALLIAYVNVTLIILRIELMVVRILSLSPKTWSQLYWLHYRVSSMVLVSPYGRLLRKF